MWTIARDYEKPSQLVMDVYGSGNNFAQVCIYIYICPMDLYSLGSLLLWTTISQ